MERVEVHTQRSLSDEAVARLHYQRVFDYSAQLGFDFWRNHFITRWFLAHADVGDEVLDVGCGCGKMTIAIAREGFRVTGIDILPEWAAFANVLLSNEREDVQRRCKFECADVAGMQRMYATVFCSCTLEHVADTQGFLAALLRVTDKRLFFAFPNGNSYPDPSHRWSFSTDEIEALLSGGAFAIVSRHEEQGIACWVLER